MLIDGLCDLIESPNIINHQKISIVRKLIEALPQETNSNVIEAYFYLFFEAYSIKICTNEIINVCLRFLNNIDVSSLDYVLSMIGESDLPEKKELITPYLNSEKAEIRNLAKEILEITPSDREFCKPMQPIRSQFNAK